MQNFSQNDEQFHILSYYKDKPTGKFIDIGAFHVERFSNTRALFLNGFSGILIEPSPTNYNAIAEHYKNEKSIIVLNIAIGESSKDLDFYESMGDAVSTSNEDHMKKWGDAGVEYNKIKVKQVGVVDFMKEYFTKDVVFISVDTEMSNMEVFENIPDYVFEQINLFCIEHDQNQESITNRLSKFGFTSLYENAENILLGKL